MYPEISRRLGGADPTRWSPNFEWLAWRLHVPQSIPDFKARALSKSLDDGSRKRALTALGYNDSPEAANAVLEVAAQSDGIVKAEALWWLLNRKDSTWKDAGLNAALQQRGIYDPDNVSLMEATIPAAEAPKYSVAEVLKLQGNAQRGAERFTSICASCHRAGDVGTEYAPNLTGWAGRQTAEVLINSVINPSAEIASGFNGTEVKTKDGLVIQGLLLSEGDPLILQSAGGLTQMIPRQKVGARKGLDRSLMMSADQLGLSPQDLADVAAFLRTR